MEEIPQREQRDLKRQSIFYSNRRQSRVEPLNVNGCTVLVQLDEELNSEEGEIIKVARKNSLESATTIGGITMDSTETYKIESIKKEIQERNAHHSPEVRLDSKSQNSDISNFRRATVKNYFLSLSHHLHLALAGPSIVRIPYLAHKYSTNSGSAFILAYFIALIVVALPICVLETAMGQFSSLGPTNMCGSCLPLIKGIGYGMIVACFILMMISNTLLTWSTFYLTQSLQKQLPWAKCPSNETRGCKEIEDIPMEPKNESSELTYIPSEFYFKENVLKSLYIENVDPLQINMLLFSILFGLGILLLFLVSRHSIWRVKIFNCCNGILTFIMLFALMVNGLSSNTSGKGLANILNLNATAIGEEMGSPDLWLDCFGQAFWSLGACIGLRIAQSSYNNFHKKIVPDVTSAVIFNFAVQLIIILSIFSYGGIVNTENISNNLGFFFVMSSFAVTKCKLPHVVSFLLYFCLCENLLTHSMALAETISTSISDIFSIPWRSGFRRFSIDFIVCVAGIGCSVLFVSKEGIFYLTTTDSFTPWVAGISLGLFEVSALTCLYSSSKIVADFRRMQESKTIYIHICKYVVVPILAYLKTLLVPSPDWGSVSSRHSEMLLKKTPKRRERSKPWLVIQVENGLIPENTSTWIPFGYSWVPEKATDQLLKEGRSDILPFTRKILADILLKKLSYSSREIESSRSIVDSASKSEPLVKSKTKLRGIGKKCLHRK